MPWQSFDAQGIPTISGGASTSVPCVRALRTTNQSISDVTDTPIQFDAADAYDTDTMHDPASNNTKITFKTAGVYSLVSSVNFASNATGVRYIHFLVNGTTDTEYVIVNAVNGVSTVIAQPMEYKFAANDYVEVLAVQTSGNPLNVAGASCSAVRVATG